MKKGLRIKFALICFITFIFPNAFQVGVLAASGSANEDFNQPVEIIETAGMNGYYEYNLYTKEETFVPASEYMPVPMSIESKTESEKPCDTAILNTFYTEYFEDDEESLIEGSSNANIQPFGVIGNDDRKEIGSVVDPYTHVCLVVARYANDKKAYGTGFLIDDRYVLTAGHLVYCKEWGGYADHFAVYAGSHNGKYKAYSLAHKFKVGGQFVSEYDDRSKSRFDDWGIVICDTSLGSVGKFGIRVTNSAADMKGYEYTTAGYPARLNEEEFNYPEDNTANLIQYKMYRATGKILNDEPSPVTRYLPVVGMDIDIEGGQSGSPIYRYISGSGNCAQAIVIGEAMDSFGSPLYNSAILINDWLYNAMVSWGIFD